MANATLEAYLDADMSDKFLFKKPIRPVIFSHGLTAHAVVYSGICRDLASQGYLVIALNHQDESCAYTETSKGVEIWANLTALLSKELRRK